jgi:muconolactone delta-isomerase
MTQRQAFVVRVEPSGDAITVEDVRAGRVARLESLAAVGEQIAIWLTAEEPAQPEPLTDSAGASPQSCSKR